VQVQARAAPDSGCPSPPDAEWVTAVAEPRCADAPASPLEALHEDVAWLQQPRQITPNDSRVRELLSELFTHTAAPEACPSAPEARRRAEPRSCNALVDGDMLALAHAVIESGGDSDGESVRSESDASDSDNSFASSSGDEDAGEGGGEAGEDGDGEEAGLSALPQRATEGGAARRAPRCGKGGNPFLEAVRALEGGAAARDLDDFIVCEEGRDYEALLRQRYG